MDSNTQPIGFFDSGVGGTSIWKEVHKLLPYENSIYLADSANAPYGPKGNARIIELSIKNTELLLEKGCKMIVVACNTATTNAISLLRAKYTVPFIGIEPAIKPAALQTKTGAIGILATKGTLSSSLFHQTADLYANGINIVEQIGTGLVELIENGQINSKDTQLLLLKYLQPMLKAKIDHLVLGCSHYPYLIPKLKQLLPNTIKIIDSGEAVAKQTKAVLEKYELFNNSNQPSTCNFYSNRDIKTLQQLIGTSYNSEILNF